MRHPVASAIRWAGGLKLCGSDSACGTADAAARILAGRHVRANAGIVGDPGLRDRHVPMPVPAPECRSGSFESPRRGSAPTTWMPTAVMPLRAPAVRAGLATRFRITPAIWRSAGSSRAKPSAAAADCRLTRRRRPPAPAQPIRRAIIALAPLPAGAGFRDAVRTAPSSPPPARKSHRSRLRGKAVSIIAVHRPAVEVERRPPAGPRGAVRDRYSRAALGTAARQQPVVAQRANKPSMTVVCRFPKAGAAIIRPESCRGPPQTATSHPRGRKPVIPCRIQAAFAEIAAARTRRRGSTPSQSGPSAAASTMKVASIAGRRVDRPSARLDRRRTVVPVRGRPPRPPPAQGYGSTDG